MSDDSDAIFGSLERIGLPGGVGYEWTVPPGLEITLRPGDRLSLCVIRAITAPQPVVVAAPEPEPVTLYRRRYRSQAEIEALDTRVMQALTAGPATAAYICDRLGFLAETQASERGDVSNSLLRLRRTGFIDALSDGRASKHVYRAVKPWPLPFAVKSDAGR